MNEQTTQFRIGGVYRDIEQNLVRLYAYPGDSSRAKTMLLDENGHEEEFDGSCRLVDGKDPDDEYLDLLPGELHLVNGQWVPVEETPEEPLALRDLFRDAMVRIGRANSFPQLFGGKPLDRSKPIQFYAHPEPKRERLTWADTKPFNPFDGFLVTKGEVSQPTPASKFTSPDLKETSHQVSPGFGSAYIWKA